MVVRCSGWITTDLFTLWIRHFVSYLCLKPLTEHPEQKKALLILDVHSTHKSRSVSPSSRAWNSNAIFAITYYS